MHCECAPRLHTTVQCREVEADDTQDLYAAAMGISPAVAPRAAGAATAAAAGAAAGADKSDLHSGLPPSGSTQTDVEPQMHKAPAGSAPAASTPVSTPVKAAAAEDPLHAELAALFDSTPTASQPSQSQSPLADSQEQLDVAVGAGPVQAGTGTRQAAPASTAAAAEAAAVAVAALHVPDRAQALGAWDGLVSVLQGAGAQQAQQAHHDSSVAAAMDALTQALPQLIDDDDDDGLQNADAAESDMRLGPQAVAFNGAQGAAEQMQQLSEV